MDALDAAKMMEMRGIPVPELVALEAFAAFKARMIEPWIGVDN